MKLRRVKISVEKRQQWNIDALRNVIFYLNDAHERE